MIKRPYDFAILIRSDVKRCEAEYKKYLFFPSKFGWQVDGRAYSVGFK